MSTSDGPDHDPAPLTEPDPEPDPDPEPGRLAALDDEEPRSEVDEYRMPLLEHLKELRTRMMRAFAAVFLAFLVSLGFAEYIVSFLSAPATAAGATLIIIAPFEGVYAWLSAGLLGGVLLGAPVLAYEIWGFVAPGLYQTEQRVVAPLALSSTLLFLVGAAFCYFAIFPIAFPFFFGVLGDDMPAQLSIMKYMGSIVKMMLAFGACFQLPIGAFFLARMGLIDHVDMVGSFRYAIVAIFVIAAIITPPDPLTQGLLATPLVLLYGVGVIIAKVFSTKVREPEPS